ncbi:MAG: hypothetical protein PWP57_403 [Candidatus Atribacteria bacterium]|nr:hypothetical protein [Candidatus Atribacteria bacterium]
MKKIEIVNKTKESFLTKRTIQKIVNLVLKQENKDFPGCLSIAVVGKEEIRSLKKRFFHQDVYTDVISFFYGLSDEDDIWGEIIICPAVIKEEAHNRGEREERALSIVLIHGLLHLLGYEDEDGEKAKVMEERQEILYRLGEEEEEREKLIKKAKEVRNHAYAPYSNFPVGAALLGYDGNIFTGCNVENTSFGLTICAERGAVVKALSQGVKEFKKIAIIADSSSYCFPCGACRQVLYEFAPQLEVIAAKSDRDYEVVSLHSLLPQAFSLKNDRKE